MKIIKNSIRAIYTRKVTNKPEFSFPVKKSANFALSEFFVFYLSYIANGTPFGRFFQKKIINSEEINSLYGKGLRV